MWLFCGMLQEIMIKKKIYKKSNCYRVFGIHVFPLPAYAVREKMTFLASLPTLSGDYHFVFLRWQREEGGDNKLQTGQDVSLKWWQCSQQL